VEVIISSRSPFPTFPSLLLVLLASVVPARAQESPADTVSPPPAETTAVETPAAPPPAAATRQARNNPWKISAELSFTDQSGNKVLRLLTGGFKVAHREREAFELDGAVQSRYGKSEDRVVARNHYASLALDLQPKEAWSPFLFFNAERDELKRLNLRFNGGAGGKYTLREDPRAGNEASISLALLYSHEDVRAAAEPTTPGLGGSSRNLARWSLRGVGRQRVNSSVSINHTSLFQPASGEMADYLLRSDTGAKVLLTKRLALSVGYQLSRTNRPPEGVHPDDRLFKTGFIIDF
jgi:putative salt-induced outer membrane protein YdiY